MAALILPSRRVVQPQEPTILRSEWQGRLIALSTPVGTLRKSGWSANSYTGSVPIGAGQFGRGFDLSPTGENKVLFSNADRPNTVVNRFYVVHATFKWRNTAAFGTIFGLYAGVAYVFTIGRWTNGSLRCQVGGSDVFASGARYLEDGRDYTIAMTLGGSSGQGGEVYINGVYEGKGSPAGPVSTTRAPAIGALDGTTGFEYNGLVYSAGIWEFGESRPAQADLLSLTDNPFQIYKPVNRRIWVPVSTGGGGGQTLSPSLLTRTKTIHDPSVSVGAVALEPSLLTRSKVLYEPLVSQGEAEQIIAPGLLTRAKTIHSPVLVPGEVDLLPPLLTRTKTIHDPSISAGATISPALLTRTKTVYGPSIDVGGVTLTPPLLTRSKAIYFPTMMGGDAPIATGGLFWPTARRRRR